MAKTEPDGAPGTGDEHRIDGLTRSEMCAHFARKVEVIARRVGRRTPSDAPVNHDDLVSQGMIGLLEAWERFEQARGISFGAFAEYRIRGAMFDALRAHDPFSRRRRDLSKKLRNAQQEAETRLGRVPAPEEVAEELGMSLEEYWRAKDKVQPVTSVSLHGPPTGGEAGDLPVVEKIMDASQHAADQEMFAQQVRDQLRDAIGSLPERQRQCILLYYGRDMSQAEIAEVFGVTVSRVSQILTESRERLRKKLLGVLAKADIPSGLPGGNLLRELSP